jgi:hypothetical protein
MEKLTKEKSSYIEELVEFTRADLEGMKTPMERRAAVKRWAFLFGGFDGAIALMSIQGGEDLGSGGAFEEGLWVPFLSLHAEWKEALEWIVDRLDRTYQLQFSLQSYFAWSPDGMFTFGSADEGGKKIAVKAWDMGKVEEKVRAQTNEKVDEPLEVEAEEKAFPRGAQHFFEALSWFSATSLRRCLKCGRIFFHPGKREKKYCTPQCQKTASVQRAQAKKKREAREV